MTDLAAALLADVPRYAYIYNADNCEWELSLRENGGYLSHAEVLAALTAALDPAMAERAGEVLEGVTQGRVVQFHPHFCEEAEGTPFTEWDTSHDLSVIRPDGERYRIGSMRHADDAAFFQWCHANLPTLLAQNAALRAERDELSSKLEVERALTDAVHRLAKAAEAQNAALTARVEGLTEVLKKARVHIAGSAPDWHYRTQEMLASLDVALSATATTEANHE